MRNRLALYNPDEWDADQWAKFDVEVGKAQRLLITAMDYRARGIYKPSELVAALLVLNDAQDVDTEITQDERRGIE